MPHQVIKAQSGARITVMTATEALRAYNRFVDDWPCESWLVPSFTEWAMHKNIKISGIEAVKDKP